MDFRKIILKSNWAKTFLKDVEKKVFSHAYLVYSADEIMVKQTAIFMAEEIACINQKDSTLIRQRIEHGTHPDVLWYGNDLKNKMITVEEISNITAQVMLSPMESEYKIILVNHFDRANVMAQNKFLKTLEEPPQGVIFILCAQSMQPILTTIKSRCQKVNCKKCMDEDVREFLLSQFGQKPGLEDVVLGCEDNLSQATKLYQDEDYVAIKRVCLDIVTKMSNSSEVLQYSSAILTYKDRIEECLTLLEQTFSDLLKYQHGAIDQMKYIVDKNGLKTMSFVYSDSAIYEIIKKIGEGRKMLKSNCQVQGVMDWVLLGILEARYQCK